VVGRLAPEQECGCVYVCPHTHTAMCVLVLLYVCRHTVMGPLILVHQCPHATAYVSAYYCIWCGDAGCRAPAQVPRERASGARMTVGVTGRILLHTAIYVSSNCYIYVLICSSPGSDERWRHRPRMTVGVTGPTLIRAAIYVFSHSSPGLG
jgi:hypothetical protein